MKSNRRHFIKKSSVLSGLLVVNPLALFKSKSAPKPIIETHNTLNAPMVISTWNFGIEANAAAWNVLSKQGFALDAVEAGVRVPEGDPHERSVGLGGRPDRDGYVTLDACIMDEKGNIGAVAALEHIVHPISVARAVMEKTPHVMLVGAGALAFALNEGFKKETLLTAASEQEWKEWLKTSHYQPAVNIENHDTIGMLAMDSRGHLSGACTTSGMAFKMHGRVGDSPIIGAGLYVDDDIGAATATGHGEEVIRIAGSHTVVELMRQGKSPQQACEEAVKRIFTFCKKRQKDPKSLQIGFIAINKKGQHGAYALQRGFTYALYSNAHANVLFEATALL
ncbi:MAG: N(4)-(beta-N-acetylglucosaminyl)-L-asparaginase [Bacteroidia bacterium]